MSKKHACIFYDALSDNYELLNYSEHGTTVDNCVYGFNLEDDRQCITFFGANSRIFANKKSEEENIETRAARSSSMQHQCDCRLISRPNRLNQWEGPAHLKHGSLIQIGCLNFIFIIVNDSELFFPKSKNRANDNVSKGRIHNIETNKKFLF